MVRGRIGKSIKWGRVGGENKSWLMKRKARHMMNINPLKGSVFGNFYHSFFISSVAIDYLYSFGLEL